MKKISLAIVVLAGVILLCSLTNSNSSVQEKWEYKVLYVDSIKNYGIFADDIKRTEIITQNLNKLGAEGWELVTPQTYRTEWFYFKRKL